MTGLDHLWAGWRSEYVTAVTSPGREDHGDQGAGDHGDAGGGAQRGPGSDPDDDPGGPAHCVFCRIAASGEPSRDNGVLWRGRVAFAVLNAYPYASGHLMVMPLRHVASLGELTEDEHAEVWQALRAAVAALERAYRPEGVNLGANLGRAAGAGIPRHLHVHAVPRWIGDTNFMTAVAGVRVLPEALGDTWDRLHRAWEA